MIPGIIIGVVGFVLFVMIIIARRINKEANNFSAIVGTVTAIQGKVLDIFFAIYNVKNVPNLVLP
jgi:hypothetical protein